MDQVIPNLWIGDIHSALNTELLRQHNIHSVLTAMRGRVAIHETFVHHQIQLDDTDDADALAYFPQCIAFIEAELDEGRGVLVHCQAGMSRSATIVAAYLMYARHLDATEALELVRTARPCTQPNDGFLQQLDVFYNSSYKVNRRDKPTRLFYLERAFEEIMNGDGTLPEVDMFAKYPRTPSESAPPTPGGPRRRIRCKMCRRELATREHMMDHGQVGPATPASVYGGTPATSRRPSASGAHPLNPLTPLSRRPSASASTPAAMFMSDNSLTPMTPLTSLSHHSSSGISNGIDRGTISRRVSSTQPRSRLGSGAGSDTRPRRPSLLGMEGGFGRGLIDRLSMSALETEDDDDDDDAEVEDPPKVNNEKAPKEEAVNGFAEKANGKITDAPSTDSPAPISSPPVARAPPPNGGYIHPHDLAAHLATHPQLAALRGPISPTGAVPVSSTGANANALLTHNPRKHSSSHAHASPPLLINTKCSGYFVEPMEWMEPFLADGQLAGKILCPNKKCGAKLGNYDWAGVCCSCKEWVTPGFCIHRSKVDEVV